MVLLLFFSSLLKRRDNGNKVNSSYMIPTLVRVSVHGGTHKRHGENFREVTKQCTQSVHTYYKVEEEKITPKKNNSVRFSNFNWPLNYISGTKF